MAGLTSRFNKTGVVLDGQEWLWQIPQELLE